MIYPAVIYITVGYLYLFSKSPIIEKKRKRFRESFNNLQLVPYTWYMLANNSEVSFFKFYKKV